MTLIRWALSFLQPYRVRVAAIAALSVLGIGLTALAPWALKLVVDNVLGGLPFPDFIVALAPDLANARPVVVLVVIVAAGLAVQIANELVRLVHTQLQVVMGQRIVYDLRARLLAHLQALPLSHHVETRSTDAVYRLDADAYCVDDLVMGGVFPLALAALHLAVMFVILVSLDMTLGLLALAVMPFLYLCLRYYAARMTDRAERVKALESTLLERAFEILRSIAAIKSFVREHHELAQFSTSGRATMRARLQLTWQESLFSVNVTAITLAGTALVLIVGGLHVLDGTLTVGSLLVVIAYLAAVYDPVSEVARTTGSLRQALVSARRVQEIFALTPETVDAPDAVDASRVVGRLRYEDVSFSYDGTRTVVNDVSFDAKPGELVALIGPTGAGKTTLANLIPRFFTPSDGRIVIDDVDITRYSLSSLRQRIALVPQDPVLFTGTIADNIRYGRLSASDADVEQAAQAAHIDDRIRRLPNGYDTPVAEDGGTLSGGERQRLGIARALLKNAPILILDEPTSAVDAISEAAIFDALRRLRAGRTTIVIAHRLSTIRDATRILVLDQGRLVAQGTHDALMGSSDLYRRMCAHLSVGQPLGAPVVVDELMRA